MKNPRCFLIFWLVCSILSSGIINANFGERFGYDRKNLGFSVLMGIVGGPVTLFASFFITGFCEHGINWRVK